MQFRLLYQGRLLGASRNSSRAEHKHAIRCELSPQLLRLIETKQHLRTACCRHGFTWFEDHPDDHSLFMNGERTDEENRDMLFSFWMRYMAHKSKRGDQGFIPLITEEMDIRCGIDVLFLRPEEPGMIVGGGDLDNRLKTLLDALRVPSTGDGFESQENPIFCLLQDDKLISELRVTADQLLLLPHEHDITANDVFLVANVTVESPPSNIWHQAWA